VLLIIAGFVSYSQINSGSPEIPFGSGLSYMYGIKPTNLPTSGTYTTSQDAADAYNAWKTNFVVSCSNGSRVLFDDNSSTVSEGIGYGMLLSAYAGDKTTFDALWKYYKSHSNGNGVMNWKYSNCDNVSGTNGATDAEEDAAMALVIAERQWPSATSPYDYGTEAKSLISKIRQYEIHPSTYQVVNGDAWGFNNSCRNPGYIATAYYREFAIVESNNTNFWNSTVSTAQSFLLTNRNATTGLISNWADNNASPNSCNGNIEFGWDAIRGPWRMATDVIWNGTTKATTASDICSKMAAWAKDYADNLKGPVSLSASNPGSGQYKNGTFAMIGLVFMAAGNSYQSQLNTAYANIVGLGNTEAYFSRTLRCLTLFMMTGNFWNPSISGQTAPEATITPASATTFCTGGSVVLNANTGSGYTYQWKKDNNNIQGATSASYTATTAGSYTVEVTANSLSTTSAATTITVNASPAANAGSDVTICTGKSANLTASGGNSYAWSNNITGANNTVSPTSTTTYTVTVTGSNNCTATDAVVVTVNAIPGEPSTTTPVSYIVGATASALTATGSNLLWYTTSTGGTGMSSSPVPSTTSTGTTSYYVTQTVGTCESNRAKIDVVVSPPTVKIQLITGWNIIGCPLTGTNDLAKALSSIWDNVVTVKNNDSFYDKNTIPAFNSLGTVSWGCGYLVEVSAPCELDWIVR